MKRRPACLLAMAALVAAAPRPADAWTTLLNGTRPAFIGSSLTAIDAFDAVYVGGRNTTAAGTGPLVLKLANEVEVWRYTAVDQGEGSVEALVLDSGGNPVIGSNDLGEATGIDWVVTKLAADSGAVVWRTVLDGGTGASDSIFAVDVDPDGHVLVSGEFYDALGPHFAVAKLDGTTGAEIWLHVVPSTDSQDRAWDVTAGPGGDVYACGTYGGVFVIERLAAASGTPVYSLPIPSGAAWFCTANGDWLDAAGQFDDGFDDGLVAVRVHAPSGTPVWAYTVKGDATGDFTFDFPTAIAHARDGSGDVFVAASMWNTTTNADWFLVRLNGDTGVDEWIEVVDGGAQGFDYPHSLTIAASGHPIVGGGFVTADGTSDANVLRFHPETGDVLWTARFDGAGHGDDTSSGVATTGSGDIVVSGNTFDGADGSRILNVRLRAADGVELARFVAGSDAFASQDEATAIARDAAGDLFVGGGLQDRHPSADPPLRFTVAKLDGRRGTERWRYVAGAGTVRSIAVDPDGNALVAGELDGPPDDRDATIVKLAPDGQALWVRQFSGGAVPAERDVANVVAAGADGTVHVAGRLWRPGTFEDLFVVKLSSAGTELWRRIHAGPDPSSDVARALALAPNGDVIVGGDTGPGSSKWLVMRLAAADGSIVWDTTLAGTEPADSSSLSALAVDPVTGDVVAVGSLDNTGTPPDFGVVRLAAADGVEMWRATYDGTASTSNMAEVVAIDAGGEILAGGFVGNVATGRDPFVVKLGPDKTQRWTHTAQLQTISQDHTSAVSFGPSGEAILLATVATSSSETDILFLGIDGTAGSEIWRRIVDGPGSVSHDAGAALVVDAGGGVAAAGTISTPGTDADFAAIRLAARGQDAACVKNAPDDPDCRPCADGCDDVDPCTGDTCDATSFCAWTPVAGDAATTCAFERPVPPASCAGARVPRPIRKTFKRAGKAAVQGTRAKTAARATKAFRRSSRLLDRMLRQVDKAERRKRRPLPAACAQALRNLAADAQSRVSARLAGA